MSVAASLFFWWHFGISAENNMTPTNIFYDDENALHTPMIQEDQTDPLKKFFNK